LIRALIFSDIHGGFEAFQKLHAKVQELGINFDLVLFGGDFSNYWFEGNEAIAPGMLVMAEFERFTVPVYYIRGNRDVNTDFRQALKFDFKGGVSIENQTIELSDGIKLTGNAESPSIDRNTILLTHYEQDWKKFPGFWIAGHTHQPRYSENFLNAGFVYRTADHGVKPMSGIFWVVDFEGTEEGVQATDIRWYAIEGKDADTAQYLRRFPFKEIICPKHVNAGTWVVPFYYKNCPLCFE
jgi:predicted phosphodiesterase